MKSVTQLGLAVLRRRHQRQLRPQAVEHVVVKLFKVIAHFARPPVPDYVGLDQLAEAEEMFARERIGTGSDQVSRCSLGQGGTAAEHFLARCPICRYGR